MSRHNSAWYHACARERNLCFYWNMLTKQQTPASPNASISRPGITTLAEVLPGEEVLQRPGLVLLLTDDAVSLLLLHLPNARREGVDVVEHGLHGDGDFVRLLTRGGKKNYCLFNKSYWESYSTCSQFARFCEALFQWLCKSLIMRHQVGSGFRDTASIPSDLLVGKHVSSKPGFAQTGDGAASPSHTSVGSRQKCRRAPSHFLHLATLCLPPQPTSLCVHRLPCLCFCQQRREHCALWWICRKTGGRFTLARVWTRVHAHTHAYVGQVSCWVN